MEVVIMGWISTIRDHGNIRFIMIRDMYDDIQVIAKKSECTEQLFEQIRQIKEHTTLAIRGKVRSQRKAPNGAEVMPLELKIFSIARKSAPFVVQSKISSVGIDTRLNLRAIDLRRNVLRSIFHIRHTTLNAIREFFVRKRFIEVNTPKMIATATEGGAALFPIFYYDREAFLAQSLDYNDIIILLEDMLSYIIESVKKENKNDLNCLSLELPSIKLPFPKYTYSNLIDQLQDLGERIAWGDDLSPQSLKKLPDDRMNGFYFITDWPTSIKPFYVKPKSTGSDRVCESFDLMYGSLEISSGSTRINRKDELLERMKKQGLDIQSFDFHIKVFDYGIPPHAGFGMGLERLLMAITTINNIRDVTLYPRDIDRLTP